MSTEILRAPPRLRGVSHQFAFFVALGAGAALLALTGRWPVAVYAVTLAALFGVSASYHRGGWRPAARRWWQRADHATIFTFIAGTYTPLCALGIGGTDGLRLLVVIWTGAVLGAMRALVWPTAPRWIAAALYVLLGWSVLVYLPVVAATTGALALAAIIAGGVLYTVGALTYALRWPDPAPRVFGYHEVFHALVIAAAICHFAAVVLVLRGAAAR